METTVLPADPGPMLPPDKVPAEPPVKTYEKRKVILLANRWIWYALGIVEVLLIFRFVLKILAANFYSPFALLVYGLTFPFVLPFYGLFNVTMTSQGSVFEWPTLVALVVYVVLACFIVAFFHRIKPVTPREVEQKV